MLIWIFGKLFKWTVQAIIETFVISFFSKYINIRFVGVK